MRAVVIVAALWVAALMAACDETPTGPDGGDPIDPTATFTRVQNEIFTPTCAVVGCHNPVGQQSQLVLTADVSYQNIVNVRSVENPSLNRIAPNDPDNSYLFRKVNGTGISGERMPQGRPPLSAASIALIRDWIRRGAPRD